MKKQRLVGLIAFSLIISSCSSIAEQSSFSLSSDDDSIQANNSSSNYSSSDSSIDSNNPIQYSFSQDNLTPIPEEMMAALQIIDDDTYECSTLQSSCIETIYDNYKTGFDVFDDFKQQITLYEISAEEEYHCYYLAKEDYEEYSKLPMHEWPSKYATNHYFLKSGITIFSVYYYDGPSSPFKEKMTQPIMEMVVSSDINAVPLVIDDYYLLDIVRLYRFSNKTTEENKDISLIDFVPYEKNEETATIINDISKSNMKFIGYNYEQQNQYYYRNSYGFLVYLEAICSKIIIENELEIIKNDICYRKDYIKDDPSYYEELEKCMVDSYPAVNAHSVGTQTAIFDYQKLLNLFGISF